MTEVLYRKFRPQCFKDVINQSAVKTILRNALKSDRLAHAYLFTGPRGVGKTTIARILAKVLNCLQVEDGEPCMKCEICMAVQQNRFLDLLEIDAASYTGVDNIREIIDQVRFAPGKGKYKVIIIDEVHMLSKAAFNALLKTLEEPPAHAIFIMATTEVHKVPATIISRTQRFDFKAVSQANILELFDRVLSEQQAKISGEALRLIASAASGSFRDGLSILDQVMSFSEAEITLEQVEEILGITRVETHQKFFDFFIRKQNQESVAFVKGLVLEGKDIVQFIRNFLEYLQLILYVKLKVDDVDSLGLLPEDSIKLSEQAENISADELLIIIKKMIIAFRDAKISAFAEIPLLVAVVELTAESAIKDNKTNPARIHSTDQKQSVGVTSDRVSDEQETTASHGMIMERWSEVMAKVKEYNHSLLSSLRLGRIVQFGNGSLQMAFPYSFHKETIDARKNKIIIEQVLEEVFGSKIAIVTRLERDILNSSDQITESRQADDLLSEAVKVLGNVKEE